MLKFGLMQDFRNPRQWRRPYAELYHQILEQIVRAEELGYDNVWLTEMPSGPFGKCQTIDQGLYVSHANTLHWLSRNSHFES
jgi:alkanesulfonate monooxygenase SsuD/methylene tetrahydromethanopterin reductase-like flavin-dependent oxidoreductase (luciferase family)